MNEVRIIPQGIELIKVLLRRRSPIKRVRAESTFYVYGFSDPNANTFTWNDGTYMYTAPLNETQPKA